MESVYTTQYWRSGSAQAPHLPSLRSVTCLWWLDISYGGSACTAEVSDCYKPPPSPPEPQSLSVFRDSTICNIAAAKMLTNSGPQTTFSCSEGVAMPRGLTHPLVRSLLLIPPSPRQCRIQPLLLYILRVHHVNTCLHLLSGRACLLKCFLSSLRAQNSRVADNTL